MVHPAFKAARLTTVKSSGNTRDTSFPSTSRPSSVSTLETAAASDINHHHDDESRISTVDSSPHVSTPTGITSHAIVSCHSDSNSDAVTHVNRSPLSQPLSTSPPHAGSSSDYSESTPGGRKNTWLTGSVQTTPVQSSPCSMTKTSLPLSSRHLQRSPRTDGKRSRSSLQDRKLNTSDVLCGSLNSKRKRKLMSSPPRAFLPGHKPLATFRKLLMASRASATPPNRSPAGKTAPATPNPLGFRDHAKAIDALVSILMCHRAPPGLMVEYLEVLFLHQMPLVLHGQFLALLTSEPFFIHTMLQPNPSRQQVLPILCIAYNESRDSHHYERMARIQQLPINDYKRRAEIASLFGDELY